jgi:hypothetical protein
MGATLDTWVWVVYFTFLGISFIGAIVAIVEGIIKRRYSTLTILLIPLFIVMNIIKNITRLEQNEWENWVNSLATGQLWAIICLAIFLYIIYWWIMVIHEITKRIKKNRNQDINH